MTNALKCEWFFAIHAKSDSDDPLQQLTSRGRINQNCIHTDKTKTSSSCLCIHTVNKIFSLKKHQNISCVRTNGQCYSATTGTIRIVPVFTPTTKVILTYICICIHTENKIFRFKKHLLVLRSQTDAGAGLRYRDTQNCTALYSHRHKISRSFSICIHTKE